MDIIQTIANRLGGNRGLAEKAIYLLDNYIDWNSLEEELSYLGNDEESCLEACQGEASNIEDRINADTDYNYWLILRDYFVDMENKNTVWAGLGELLLLYYRYKKGNLSENMKKKVVKINESQLRNMVAESVKKVLKEDYIGKNWFDESPNNGMFSENFEKVLNDSYKAADILLDACVKEISNVQDMNAKRDLEIIKEQTSKYLTSLHSYVPGNRIC